MQTGRRNFIALLSSFFCAFRLGLSAEEPSKERGRGGQGGPPGVFYTDIPSYKGNVILTRPTDHSITLSVLFHEPMRIKVLYGLSGKSLENQTAAFPLDPGKPLEIVLDNLTSYSSYDYRVVDAESGSPLLPLDKGGSFRTSRAFNESFIFTLQADSHLDENSLPELYPRCIQNALADRPDFHIDLGDTSMTGKHPSRESALLQYAAQRYYLGLIGHSSPLFLMIGNHDGEETFKPGCDGPEGLAVWSALQRKKLCPNPLPDSFYGGNSEIHPYAGALQNYYSWHWGNTLLVVLDPYWTSRPTQGAKQGRGGKDPWNMSLGKTQYDWLAKTLRESKATHKLVFIHQLTGGLDQGGRGGSEAAPLYEWGGHDKEGRNTFQQNRPGWEKPIHELLKETGVKIVFHGHDHFFAKQEQDGIIYQLVPQCANRNPHNDHAAEYGYQSGVFLPNSGHLRVRIDQEQIGIDYICASIDRKSPAQEIANGTCVHTYTVKKGNEGKIS